MMLQNLDDINQKSREVVLSLLPDVAAHEVTEDADLFDLGLDSINAMSLVLNLQNTFGVVFDASDISFENFSTVGDIAELIKRKIAASSPAKL